jgi:RecA/RadA recombinase
MATRKPAPDAPKFDLKAFYAQTSKDVIRKQGLSSDPLEDIQPMSSGWLMLDLIFGGGMRPAMYTFAGEEQTAKTTLALSILAEAIKTDVPLKAFWDYEGSTKNSRTYIANILRTAGVTQTVDEIFGKTDKETGEILIHPLIDYFATGIGEAFFDWLAEIERTYPDKRYVGGKWWLVFEDTKENKAKVGEFVDDKASKRYGKGLYVPAPDGNLQGVVVIDAWSAMNPSSNDEQEADNSLGVLARFFSKHLIRIKARLSPKMIAVIGMNHLADIPMAMYGPKQKEKGGNDLRSKSDVRIWNFKRAINTSVPFSPVADKEEGCEVEKSVTGQGSDRYNYVMSKNIKNKLSLPKRKAWFRLWTEDAKGDARGFDPHFDTMCYLRETGQLEGNVRKKLTLKLEGVELKDPTVNWMELKTLVLGTEEQKVELRADIGLPEEFDLRQFCFDQVASGRAEVLYSAKKNGVSAEEAEEDDDAVVPSGDEEYDD